MKKETIQLYDGLNIIINVNTDTHKIEISSDITNSFALTKEFANIEISRFDKLIIDLRDQAKQIEKQSKQHDDKFVATLNKYINTGKNELITAKCQIKEIIAVLEDLYNSYSMCEKGIFRIELLVNNYELYEKLSHKWKHQ